jgi:hypothetical protein
MRLGCITNIGNDRSATPLAAIVICLVHATKRVPHPVKVWAARSSNQGRHCPPLQGVR